MAKRRWWFWSLLAVVALTGATLFGAAHRASPAAAQEKGHELVVYNQDLALVKDTRNLSLTKGLNEVRFGDVAALIDATSVHFQSLTDAAGTVVLEQNYEYDVVDSGKLLSKYVDQEISVVTQDGKAYTGTLLSGVGDVILEAKDGQVTVLKLDQIKEFNFPALPQGLITRPTLVWQLESAKGGNQAVEVTYLTAGVNWRADYTAVLADDEKTIDLNGWVTLDNRSGTSYQDAKLKLVAGDIHRAPSPGYVMEKQMVYDMAATPTPQVEERAFFEYHLYEVQRPVTVKDQQTKQIEFVTGSDIPAQKVFVYDGAQMAFGGYYQPIDDPAYGTSSNKKVMVMLEFKNGEAEGLGVPLPRGTVRVYKNDVDGSTLFIGEDAIDHTPKDEQVRLYIGDAFDIVGERVQSDFKVDYDNDWMEESYKITLRNHKEEDVEVRVVEHMFRWSEWKILNPSQDFQKLDAQTIEFRVPVKAGGEATVTYTVRYEW